jgi:NAD-dependent deacetylase
MDASVSGAKALIARAQRIVALTGAGISTESGIADFRGPQGVWTKDPAAEKLATLSHYMGSAEVRRAAWQKRLETPVWSARPNSGHDALVRLEQAHKLHTLVTQNIDGLHQRAGSSPENVIEIHGTVHEVVCMSCGERGPMTAALDRVRAGELDPPCISCGGILKSATISFGQSLVLEDLQRAERAARHCDLLLAIGTKLSVFPVAGLVPVAKRHGAQVVIVNAEPTDMDELADEIVRGSIGEMLPRLVGAD